LNSQIASRPLIALLLFLLLTLACFPQADAQAPSITTQPQSQTVITGGTANFTVTATGGGTLRYQWRKTGTNISGATRTIYTISNVQSNDSGFYSVQVTNTSGTVTSSKATLTVVAPPPNDLFSNSIALNGVSAAANGYNFGAGKTVGEPNHAGNAGGSSVWWSWTAPVSGTVTLDTIGSSFDTLLAVYIGVAVNNLSLVASNDDYGGDVTSQLSFIASAGTNYKIAIDGFNGASGEINLNLDEVAGVAPQISIQPLNQFITANAQIVLSVSAIGYAPLSYQWRKESVNIPSATSSAFSIANAQVGNSGNYTVVVTNLFGRATSVTAVVTIVVPPQNDNFSNSFVLPYLTNHVTGSNVNATVEPGEYNHFWPIPGHSVWWKWAATTNWTIVVDTFGSSIPTVIEVYTGNSLPNLSTVAFSSSGQLSFTSVVGVTYQIMVDGFGGATGSISLNVRPASLPSNDAFTNSAWVSGLNTNLSGQNALATKEPGEPDHAGEPGSNSVWYAWTAPTNLTTTIEAIADSGYSGFYELLGVYKGNSVSNLSPVVGRVSERKVWFFADAGTTYRIAVDGKDGSSGTFTLNLQSVLPPPNDAFTNGLTIIGTTNMVHGNNLGATREPGEPDHAGERQSNSVWYAWTAPSNSTANIKVIAADGNYELLGVYTGDSLANLSSVVGRVSNREIRFSAVAGTTYKIAVDGGFGYGMSFNLYLQSQPPPPNDNFANRLPIDGMNKTVLGRNAGATTESGEPNHAYPPGDRSVWWKWNAPTNGIVTLDTIGSSFTTVLGVYTGDTVSNLTQVSSSFGQYGLSFSALAGTNYQIAVDGWNSAEGAIVVNLRQASANSTPTSVTFKGNWPGFTTGPASDVKVVGTFAYLAISNVGLLIVDVSDPANPRKVGAFGSPGQARSVTVAGDYAYLADGLAGFEIIDVRNPVNPVLAGASAILTNVNQIAVRSNYLYIADGSAGLCVFDAGNQIDPIEVAAFQGPAEHLAFDGDYAYVSEQGSICIVDISIQEHPVLLTSLTNTRAGDLAVTGGYLFALGGSGLDVYDLSNPINPVYLSSTFFSVFYVTRMCVENGKAFISAPGSPDFQGDLLLEVDVSNPEDPQVVRTFGGGELGAAVANKFLYAAGSAGLSIFDLSIPTDYEQPISRFFTAAKPFNIVVQGNYAYLANGDSGLQIIDISNPGQPTLAGSLTGRWPKFNVAAMGAYAFLEHVEAIDVSDPRMPHYLGQEPSPPPWDRTTVQLVTSDRQLYAFSHYYNFQTTAESNSRGSPRILELYDMVDRVNPRFALSNDFGFPQDGAICSDLRVKGNFGFLATNSYNVSSLIVYDTNNFNAVVTRPTELHSITSIELAGNLLVLGGKDGLQIFDVSSATNPLPRGRFGASVNPTNSFSSLEIANGRVVAVETTGGLHVIDVSDSTNLVQVGSYPSQGFEKIALAGNYALIAAGDQGLTILDLGASFATVPAISFQPQSTRVLPGANVRFDVGAKGTVPMSYQWQFYSTNLPGATNFLLTLQNVQQNQAGPYSVVVSNPVGSTVSAYASFTVDAPPDIEMTSPEPDSVFLSSAAIPLSASVSDSDGSVAKVQFYNGATLLATMTNAPFIWAWTNVLPGAYVLHALATDNEGATNVSNPVTINVTTNQVIQLSKAHYDVNESNGVAVVTIRRNAGGTANVAVFTMDGSARAVVDGGYGSYYTVSNTLTFPSNVTATNISILIVNDLVFRGSRDFTVMLSAPSGGWSLGYPSTATITITDDDLPATADSLTEMRFPDTATNGLGSLQVTLMPTQALGSWRFSWETAWRNSGSTATGLAPGNYTIEFMPRGGFIAPPSAAYAMAAGSNPPVIYTYTTNQGGSQAAGALSLSLLPSAVQAGTNRGQWRLQGELGTNWYDSGTVITNLPTGLHIAEFKPITGYETPAPRFVAAVASATNFSQATYSLASTAGGAGPVALPGFSSINDGLAAGLPFAFNGQLLSDVGYGSGFVVKPHTVLTAAHVVFDAATLSYVPNVRWFFQRHKGEYEPVPQQPRGSYVLNGYASARRHDMTAGLDPGESSLESRNLDVAALSFGDYAGRGLCQGGYLVSDTNTTQWLLASGLKVLIGYPVEQVADEDKGKMHQTGPGSFQFELVTNQIYRSYALKSYPGNSGGPLCVQATNGAGNLFFIPAGVFLGGSNQTIVRAIDRDVVDVINQAEVASAAGDNSTGGGPIKFGLDPATAPPDFTSPLFRVDLPPDAVTHGARWRASGTTNWSSDNSNWYYTTNPVLTTNLTIEFAAADGYATPQPVNTNLNSAPISPGNHVKTAVIPANYGLLPAARLVVSPVEGFNSSRIVGGFFSQTNKTYTLANSGGAVLNWTVGNAATWLLASPSVGTLAAGASTNVTVALTADAFGLSPGGYTDTLNFNNNSTGNLGSTNRPVALNVIAPPQLTVLPASDLVWTGYVGDQLNWTGTYTVSNAGGINLDWAWYQTNFWLNAVPSSGTIPGGGSIPVVLTVNALANNFINGAYTNTLLFTSQNGAYGSEIRHVMLTLLTRPGQLGVSPTNGFSSSGKRGGPFSPSGTSYTLTNAGTTTLSWTAKASGEATNWLNLSPANGTLLSGATNTVSLTISTNANQLNSRSFPYGGLISFTNVAGLGGTAFAVFLNVNSTNFPSRLTRLQLLNNGSFTATLQGEPGQVYSILGSSNVTAAVEAWMEELRVTNTGSQTVFTNQLPPGAPRRYYRAKEY
jgi:hypothetical protein